jgi:hypothetical protein
LVRRLRAAWPEVKITVRGDSGFGRWRRTRWCDSHGIGSVLGLAKNPALERAARDEIERAARQFLRTGQPPRLLGTFSYAAVSWDRPRRVLVKAEHNDQGSNPRFVVTNVPGDPKELEEDVYYQRGEMEDRIKEHQLDLFTDRTRCHRFLAHQFRLLLVESLLFIEYHISCRAYSCRAYRLVPIPSPPCGFQWTARSLRSASELCDTSVKRLGPGYGRGAGYPGRGRRARRR